MVNDEITSALTERAQQQMQEWTRPIIIEADISVVVALIGMCQLALRHPFAKVSPSAKLTEKFIVDLIEKIDPQHGDLWRLLNMGFNPNHDV